MPDFQLMDTERRICSLLSLVVGKPIVVLFYPGNKPSLTRDTLRGWSDSRRPRQSTAPERAITRAAQILGSARR